MNLLLRADANALMGTGHVMRCLALAQAWQDRGGLAAFLSAPLPSAIETRLSAEGLAVVALKSWPGGAADAAETIRQAEALQADWVVVDGYQFDAAYHKALKDAGLKLLVLDDNGDSGFYWADLVLNQNIHAQADWYKNRASYTRLLLGTQYALLRREFLAWRGWQRDTPETAYKILVTLGGSDPDNVTLKVLEALSEVERLYRQPRRGPLAPNNGGTGEENSDSPIIGGGGASGSDSCRRRRQPASGQPGRRSRPCSLSRSSCG